MIHLSQKTLAELCTRASVKYKNRVAFETYRDGRIYRPLTYRLLEIRARQFASLLLGLGVKAGDRALLLSENSPDWAAAFFGIARAGAVVLPVSADLDIEEIRRLAEYARVSAICAGGKFGAKLGGFMPGIPRIFIDSPETRGRSGKVRRGKTEDTFITAALHGVAKKLPFRNPPADFRFPAREGGDPALVAIRGEGPADFEEISGQSLIAGAAACLLPTRLYPRDRMLPLVPLAQCREYLLGLLAAVMSGSLVAFPSCAEPAEEEGAFLSAAQALRPTVMLSDSAFIEKLCGEKIIPALRENPLYRSVLTRGLAEYRAGRKLLKQLGSSVRFFAVSGRALSEETETFLRQAEFPLARCREAAAQAGHLRSTTAQETGLPSGG
ncbi:MAG: long-chain fatty acid--CoA ligase [Treponema sp.]|jgi:long-chain acyl-CoA synthetase|nr:long-chain fatty acid--CoA ligase [Treponema sp.]